MVCINFIRILAQHFDTLDPDQDPKTCKQIRIGQNNSDYEGSGSATLKKTLQ